MFIVGVFSYVFSFTSFTVVVVLRMTCIIGCSQTSVCVGVNVALYHGPTG